MPRKRPNKKNKTKTQTSTAEPTTVQIKPDPTEYPSTSEEIGDMKWKSYSNKKKDQETLDCLLELENSALALVEATSSKKLKEKVDDLDDKDFFDKLLDIKTEEPIPKETSDKPLEVEYRLKIAHYQERLKLEREINDGLRKELRQLAREMDEVKKKNDVLTAILTKIERRDSVEVILDIERMKIMKRDLTEEVDALQKLLDEKMAELAKPKVRRPR